jgi:thiosulfate reductase cytochrome b subunit
VYRVGIGHWTLFRFFPEWFYAKLGLQFGLAQGLSFHFFVMWFFALNGVLYVCYLAWSGEWRTLVPRRESWKAAWGVVLHDLHLRRDAAVNDKYNGAQRISYTAIVLMGAASLLTGLAIYKPVQLGWLTRAMGGYEMARWLHFWLTIGFVLFFVVHVVQVAIAGWGNFQSMVTGVEVVREDAKSEVKR